MNREVPARPVHQDMAFKASTEFSWRQRFRSFVFAGRGILFMLRTQHNAWLHFWATLVVVGLGLSYRVKPDDWRMLIVAIVMVWVAETFNTAVEHICDVVSPGYSEAVKRAKDVAAGAVLICALGAAMIGLATFWPYVMG